MAVLGLREDVSLMPRGLLAVFCCLDRCSCYTIFFPISPAEPGEARVFFQWLGVFLPVVSVLEGGWPCERGAYK